MKIVDNKIPIGFVWYAIDQQKAWLYFLGIDAVYQGKGYGLKALESLQRYLSDSKISSLGLNVFASNQRAFALYKKTGFAVEATISSPTSEASWRYEMRKSF